LKLIVGPPKTVHPIRPGFLGLSLEYQAIEAYAGTDPNAIDPVLLQLIRNLTPYQSPVLRIGGDSTDATWWPVDHMAQPGGIRYALTPGWIAVTRALTQALKARLILGLNLEANSRTLAWIEAAQLAHGIGSSAVQAFEPGNEPELYGTWTWYRSASGQNVMGRPPGWSFPRFQREFADLSATLRGTPIAGPASGSRVWGASLGQFLASAPYLSLVTLHRYALQGCYMPESDPRYPTIEHLLSPRASRGLAASVAPYVGLVHAHGVGLRIDELGTEGCGYDPAVTSTFASALWALDALFAMADVGVDGVNVHTFPGATFQLFSLAHTHGRWQALVEPEYYGLLMFAIAAPPGSQLLHLYGPAAGKVSAWASRGTDGRLRIVLVNNDLTHARTIAVKAPGGAVPATLMRLSATGAAATQGVTLGGLGFGTRTTTGSPTGREVLPTVVATSGEYVVRLPAVSAALLLR
jgi:hypothetical protein